jgi:hypothetical protein
MLQKILSPGGRIIIFEHNPFNPMTRHMVSTCEFDVDAELITKANLIKLLRDCGYKISKSGFCLFFPGFLSFLRPIEKYLAWLFLGGQYFIYFSKK